MTPYSERLAWCQQGAIAGPKRQAISHGYSEAGSLIRLLLRDLSKGQLSPARVAGPLPCQSGAKPVPSRCQCHLSPVPRDFGTSRFDRDARIVGFQFRWPAQLPRPNPNRIRIPLRFGGPVLSLHETIRPEGGLFHRAGEQLNRRSGETATTKAERRMRSSSTRLSCGLLLTCSPFTPFLPFHAVCVKPHKTTDSYLIRRDVPQKAPTPEGA